MGVLQLCSVKARHGTVQEASIRYDAPDGATPTERWLLLLLRRLLNVSARLPLLSDSVPKRIVFGSYPLFFVWFCSCDNCLLFLLAVSSLPDSHFRSSNRFARRLIDPSKPRQRFCRLALDGRKEGRKESTHTHTTLLAKTQSSTHTDSACVNDEANNQNEPSKNEINHQSDTNRTKFFAFVMASAHFNDLNAKCVSSHSLLSLDKSRLNKFWTLTYLTACLSVCTTQSTVQS